MAVPRPVIPLAVDCSVIMKWELPNEQFTAEAAELLRDWESGAVLILSVDLLPSEIGGAILRTLRRGRFTEAQAQASLRTLLGLSFELRPSGPLVEQAYEIAYQHNQRIYDCFYVALAEREQVDLWTSDERLFNALGAHFPCIRFIRDYVPLR
jgi:predicted nucleic acid-binding protein